jgi:hypothetical protein
VSDDELPVLPESAANPPARKGALSGIEWVAGALAIVGAGLTTLAVLTAGGTPAGNATTAVTTAASSAAAQARAHDAPASGPGWMANDARWVGNTRRSLALELPAHNKVSVWMREVQPLLVVRCMAGTIDVFVYTDSASAIEPKTEDHTVRYAFDDEAEARELWQDSSEHDALFAPDGAAFARRLMEVRTFRFGFTPHNAAPVTAHFQVSGLRERLVPAVRECGWKSQ